MPGLWRRREDQWETPSGGEWTRLAVMERHRELHPLWQQLDHLPSEIMIGEMNPLVHVLMDSIVENQCAQHASPVAQDALDALLDVGFSRQCTSWYIC